MLTSLRRGLLMLLCGLAVAAPAASAQDDEVFVDPKSPSGKEYELPIDSARQQAAPKSQKQNKSAPRTSAPLFGEGVEPDDGNRGSSGATREQGDAGQDRARPGAGATRAKGSTTAERRAQAAEDREEKAAALRRARADAARRAHAVAARDVQRAAPEGAGGLVAILAVGAAVLLVGGLAGLWLRRRAAAE